jgi:GT2 family glycosyltransferase
MTDDGRITCILTLYKRPHTLLEQIAAIRAQTVAPAQIIVWRNGAEPVPDEVRSDPDLTVIDSSANFGVWARFAVGLLANTEFVCIFDDDTIPGRRWFENCLQTIRVPATCGLLGTVGLLFDSNGPPYWIRTRIGWPNPNSIAMQVDIVGHSWFFRREWLKHLWTTTPDYASMLRAGEDIGFSWALQRVGIKTFVPPHTDPETFGSDPVRAMKYGTEEVGISSSGSPHIVDAYKYYRTKGFKLIDEQNNIIEYF